MSGRTQRSMGGQADAFRPRYHFTPEHGWMNDPNGLVHFNGEWHLFYQYYEPRDVDGMQWGHAVSRDLVRWEHLPAAIAPDEHGQIWSGSAVVDHRDTSGLFGGKPGMVCIYTYWDKADHRQSQGMAYSADGRTFRKYAGNPLIPQLRHLPGQPDDKDFRDPKVFWDAKRGRWAMAVAGGTLRIFSSPNLRDWRFESVDEALVTECPDLFELPVDGDAGNTRWVLSGGGRWYMLGRFDGVRFTSGSERLVMGHGPDFYASQSWGNSPDGRRVMISWLFNWSYGCGAAAGAIRNCFPTAPFSGGCMTVPYEVTLRTTPDGVRLVQQPVDELASLRGDTDARENLALRPGDAVRLAAHHGNALDIDMEIEPRGAHRIVLRFPPGGAPDCAAGYDAAKRVLFIDRRGSGVAAPESFPRLFEAPLPMRADGSVAMRFLLDACSIELFGNRGFAAMSAFVLPDPKRQGIELYAEGGEAFVRHVRASGIA
ncbi:glycoside hydrolase family 32 protein [bacterium]|nr:glycoside hydrolase family 32 protein [bacterium]